MAKTHLDGMNNVFKGTVAARIFLGNTVRLLVDLGEEKETEVDLHADHVIACEQGDDIYICLNQEELVLVKR